MAPNEGILVLNHVRKPLLKEHLLKFGKNCNFKGVKKHFYNNKNSNNYVLTIGGR